MLKMVFKYQLLSLLLAVMEVVVMPVVSVFLEERRGGAILCTFDFLAVHLFNEVKITRTQK